ncbi:hypothetical protein [Streptomyces lavendulocolor]|uniref:hypothetical protein n=1 Tax=Streptomyces lavendulocolor TaxID=67316 RepID=UPI003C2D751A
MISARHPGGDPADRRPGHAPHAAQAAPAARPPAFDREPYKQHNTVERRSNKLKQRRRPATRYDKTATIHLADTTAKGSSSGRTDDPEVSLICPVEHDFGVDRSGPPHRAGSGS